ncbi:hypothetical protein ACNOYE_24210 [Nannocystaceae bacterium ST9]
MPTDLSPDAVARRLARLRELYVPEDRASATARLAAERPFRRESFEQGVGRRLAELRDLLELSNVLQRASRR